MMEKKKVDEDVNPPFDGERQEDEERQPSWIQKYLDLADLLMRRHRHEDDKAA